MIVKSRFTGAELGEFDISPSANLRGANLRGANLSDANLRGADLRGANLHGANLRGANLRGANLHGADLHGANLHGADLHGANLHGADLHGADLRGANLSFANLHGANLHGANLRGANLRGANLSFADLRFADLRGAAVKKVLWPTPTVVLLARWGTVSGELCVELMKFDAVNCPGGKARFDIWGKGGACPYMDVRWQRCANFKESRTLWRDRCTDWDGVTALSALELAERLLAEKCVLDE